MLKWIKKKLGITKAYRLGKLNANSIYGMNVRLQALESDFNSRDTCKICGKHRYNSSKCIDGSLQKLAKAGF